MWKPMKFVPSGMELKWFSKRPPPSDVQQSAVKI
jgi:hypothetical protein